MSPIKIRTLIALCLNTIIDGIKFARHSSIISANNQEKLIAIITFNYHSLEKGFSMPEIRLGFGRKRVKYLMNQISIYVNKNYNTKHSQFIAACSVLKKYYLLHNEKRYDVSSYFTKEQFDLINLYANPNIGGAIEMQKEHYFDFQYANYELFSKSRHSIRNFSERLVDHDKIKQAVELAKYCPSACNRQTSKVYLIEDSKKIQSILKIQQGILATSETIRQLLIITANRNSFFSSGERNQLYVDGGIFLQSMLLSLHYYGIGACPLHWSLNSGQDKELQKIIHFSNAEKPIALIAIGNIESKFRVPFSHRKNINEILVIV
mgnify:FL=1